MSRSYLKYETNSSIAESSFCDYTPSKPGCPSWDPKGNRQLED